MKTSEPLNLGIYQAGNPVIQPTAIDAWNETVKAIEVLATGVSSEGYMHEVVVTNLTLVILVTGFEAYTKKRLLELEQEGICPDTDALVSTFYPKTEIEAGITKLLESEAKDIKVSLLEHIVRRNAINFQNYKHCKRAYNKGYGIKFGDLDFPNDKLGALQSFIHYRHRIVHVSPSLGMLNQEKVPPEEPVFPKKETAEIAKECFIEFIDTLHEATLLLRS